MRRKLTVEEHLRMAEHLRRIDTEMNCIRDFIFGLGVMTRLAQRVMTVNQKVTALRCALDSALFRDHPNDGRTQPSVYFGEHGPGDWE